jgi:SH3-like domain-containing protein
MRFPVRVVLVLAWLLAAGGSLARAQSAPSSGTLLAPSSAPRAHPVKPAEAVPRRHSVHRAKTPVVPAHGPVHAHKPAGAAASAKGLPPQPAPPVAPVVPQAETKAAQPEKLPDPEKTDGGPVKLPRFVSLRSDDVNMRAGPGTKYPIDWVYKRRDLPVEIEREFEVWRWVRDADGVQGWVHQATLMGRRDFIVQKTDATLRSEASDTASAVAILKPGVIGRIRSCAAGSAWCEVQTGSYRGFLRRTEFWGVFPDEAINP